MAEFVDDSELRKFAVDLQAAAGKIAPEIRAVIGKGALNIKQQMVSEMRASVHFHGAAGSISYDTKLTHDGIEAEIGPDKDKAGGALGNIAYFGTSRGGGTVPDPVHALEAEVPNVEKYIGDLLDRLL